ncbi:STAS domain-containing protein [Pengzhenrongella sicca]|uniref:STAS domain-containing protein n=1 Tax=Pengzhenrongella sicca TaxID=2819238 RepID=A0A8A4ZF44_9MICO|nr:STAS domain-containing protein [Pengzhenrongella sicca]QTE29629.1 STAS domain-containing protein [Pengzhenrongella sicca]
MRDANSPTSGGPADSDSALETTTASSSPVTDPGSVHVLVGSERTRIVLSGDIDADVAPDLQEATAEAERARLPIEVDCHHVTFMDSSGVAFLARLSTRSPARVRVIRVPPTVRFLLEVTRIGELLDLDDGDPGSDMTVPDGTTPQVG